MFDKNSKFPRFIILMLLPITAIMFVGMFFDVKFVASAYFIALLVSVVFLMLDRRYGENVANYKLAFFLFDIINIIATVAVIYYEFAKYSKLLSGLLIALMAVLLFLILIDVILVKNKDISKKYSIWVGLINLGVMICILTYFCNVSDLFFVIGALTFEVATIVIKSLIIFKKHKKVKENENEFDIVSIIRAEEEGDFE